MAMNFVLLNTSTASPYLCIRELYLPCHLLDSFLTLFVVQILWNDLLIGHTHPSLLCILQETLVDSLTVVIIHRDQTNPVPFKVSYELHQGLCLVHITGDHSEKPRELQFIAQNNCGGCGAYLKDIDKEAKTTEDLCTNTNTEQVVN